MASQMCKRTDSWIRKYHSGVVATIVSSADGGPIRRIINGRSSRPTGHFVSVKAGFRAMPWESVRCELPMLRLAELGSPIVSLLCQPHRLEMEVTGRPRPLIYFPDLLLTVERSFADALSQGAPFGSAILEWRPDAVLQNQVCKLVVEVKDDDDPRNEDDEYQNKLDLARELYRKMGMSFVTVLRSRDLECVDLQRLEEIALDSLTSVNDHDIHTAGSCFGSDAKSDFGTLVEVLGGGHIGRAKAIALHVRRVISIELKLPLSQTTAVWRMGRTNGGAHAVGR